MRRSPFHHFSLIHIRFRIVKTIHNLSIFVLVCFSHIEGASDTHRIIFSLTFALTSASRRIPASISTIGPLLRLISVIHCIQVVTCSDALILSLTVRSGANRRPKSNLFISLIQRNFVHFKLTFKHLELLPDLALPILAYHFDCAQFFLRFSQLKFFLSRRTSLELATTKTLSKRFSLRRGWPKINALVNASSISDPHYVLGPRRRRLSNGRISGMSRSFVTQRSNRRHITHQRSLSERISRRMLLRILRGRVLKGSIYL